MILPQRKYLQYQNLFVVAIRIQTALKPHKNIAEKALSLETKPLDAETDTTLYKVVVSEEEQYSLWPAVKPTAAGWRDTGTQGSQQECLAYIGRTWTDLRPKSLRDMLQ